MDQCALCNANQYGPMCDQILSFDFIEKHWYQCLEFERTLIGIAHFHHVLLYM